MKKKFFLGLCLTTSVITSVTVYFDSVTVLSLLLYITSITSCFVHLVGKTPLSLGKKFTLPGKTTFFIISLTFLQLFLLQYFSNFPLHYIQDEFITAYTSFHLPALYAINWFSAFPDKTAWVAQFPILFFILQKPFFLLFGPTLEIIRISTWPYHILNIIYLYLLAKEYFSPRLLPFASVLLFIFLAPNLYLSSLGVHFVSSTLFFLASFYYFLLIVKKEEKKYVFALGVCLALAYLIYSSSYIILPLLFLFIFIESIYRKSTRPFELFGFSIWVFLIIMLPFLVYAITKNNFFIQRITQVSLFSATEEKNLLVLLSNQLITNFKSLYLSDIGGVNDYWFGHQPLFDAFTCALILLGLFIFLYKGIFLKQLKYIYILVIIITGFFFGMVFTIPPGAFHRLYITFPFIALLMTMSIYYFSNGIINSKNKLFSKAILSLLVAIFSITNFNSAKLMLQKDAEITQLGDSMYISSYIKNNFSKGATIFIFAFPSYHLERELFFRTSNEYKFHTNYFPDILELVQKNPIILLYPDSSQIQKLHEMFPHAIMIDSVNGSRLKHHLIVIPS